MRFKEKLAAFRAFAGKAIQLSSPYFRSEEKWRARGMLAAIVLLNLAGVFMLVQFNDWNRVFYDAIQNKDQPVFWTQLGRFTYLAFASIIIAVYRFYLTQLLEMRWRAWMTAQYMQRWLSNHAFYKMELARFSTQGQTTPDNPDQRIQEDLNLFTSATISLTMGLLNAVVTLVSFIGILWSLSGSFSVTLDGTAYAIPGFMVWMAVLYCVAGSVVTHYIGRPQIQLNNLQQRYEADYRHHLVRVREYSEAIALDHGEKVERGQLDQRFGTVLANYLKLIRSQKNLVWFTSFFGQAAVVFPMIVAAPRYFSNAIQLGELMQIVSAFDKVQTALSWFVDNYSNLAAWRATTDRLTSFDEGITLHSRPAALHTAESKGTDLQALGLQLNLPQGEPLLAGLDLRAAPGDRVLLRGPSGSGKSTLFRAVAGIWPHAQGEVRLPAQFSREAMFLPQRPYFPNGRLRDALAYPEPAERYSDEALRQALADALLPQLAARLDEEDAWGQKLSGGEQQRLAIARALLKKPRWLFADEATSALDEPAERTLYERLMGMLSARSGTLVSIAHRPGVAEFHNRAWVLEPAPAHASARFTLREGAA